MRIFSMSMSSAFTHMMVGAVTCKNRSSIFLGKDYVIDYSINSQFDYWLNIPRRRSIHLPPPHVDAAHRPVLGQVRVEGDALLANHVQLTVDRNSFHL